MERTVLIIEDEKLIIVSTQMVLEAAGFCVESAVNGEEGIQKAKSARPDLVLLDIMMPGIDGWETLTRHHGGAGLGLFVARGIVEAHGSRIEVSSQLGQGADFSFVLPLYQQAANTPIPVVTT